MREWRALATVECAAQYATYVEARLLPELRRLDGFEGVDVLERDRAEGREIVVLTRWASIEAIGRFAGRDMERAVVHPDAQAMLIRFEERVTHYEVLISAVRPPQERTPSPRARCR